MFAFAIKMTVSVLNPEDRSSATSCLQHPWLTHIGLNLGLRYSNDDVSEKIAILVRTLPERGE